MYPESLAPLQALLSIEPITGFLLLLDGRSLDVFVVWLRDSNVAEIPDLDVETCRHFLDLLLLVPFGSLGRGPDLVG